MNADVLAAIHRVPWQVRRGRRAGWVWLAILLALPPLVAWRMAHSPLQTLGAAAVVLAVWWWWVQVDSLLAQNHPNHARLVPGHGRALRTALLAHAALAGALAWAGGALLAGPSLAWALWVLAGLPLLAWTQRQPWVWLPLSLLPVLPFAVRGTAVRLADAPLPFWRLVAAAAVAGLLALLGSGGARHQQVHVRLQRWRHAARRATEQRGVSATARLPWLRRLLLPVTWPEQAWRRHLLARPTQANAVPRLDLALQAGGGAPMLAWLIVLVYGGLNVVLVVGKALRPDLAWAGMVDGSRLGLGMGLVGIVAGTPIGRLTLLWARRREQALLALLPGPPAGAGLAAALERHWRRDAVALWLLSGLLLLAIAAHGSNGTLHFVGGLLGASLPLGLWTEAQWRRMEGRARTALPALALFGGSLLAAAAAQHIGVPPWVSIPIGVLLHQGALQLRGAPPGPLLPMGRGGL
ncbi:MAG: hypothetical protein H6932_01110 [Burkholderiaceae bacterium]|nr:hypothetical protein [Burkholderiaceae bacterium]